MTVTATAARHEQVRRYVENRHIDHIPAAARHGKPWQQFVFWFGGNVNVFNVVLGGVARQHRADILVGARRDRDRHADRGAADRPARHPGAQARRAADASSPAASSASTGRRSCSRPSWC